MERNDRSAECRNPDAVEYLAKLPVIRSREGGYIACWRDGEEVLWREITAEELPGFGRNPAAPSAELGALPADAETRFPDLMPKILKAAAQPGADMDGIERALGDGCLGSGAAGLEVPECGHCGKRMARHRRAAKTFTTRLGDIEVVRTYFHCRDCGGGFRKLDRMIGAEGDNCTAGAASIIAETAAACSFAPAARMLGNLAGVSIPVSAFRRRAKAIGELAARFGREVVEGAAAGRCHLAVDGTGVPMRREETEGVKGRQEDGSARTREAKVAVACTAEDRHPGTGEPGKDRGSETVSAAIDSAAAVGGLSTRSDFAARLERLVYRTGGHVRSGSVARAGPRWRRPARSGAGRRRAEEAHQGDQGRPEGRKGARHHRRA